MRDLNKKQFLSQLEIHKKNYCEEYKKVQIFSHNRAKKKKEKGHISMLKLEK
jgi:hypothetical protein